MSKIEIEGLKLRYQDTTAFVLGSQDTTAFVLGLQCQFLDRLLFLYFGIYYNTTSPGKIDTILACAQKRHTILGCPITDGVK